MKNYFPQDYCPQREKVLDLSRSVLSGRTRYARNRKYYGRHQAKVVRRNERERLGRAVAWSCTCGGDPEIDCGRCYSDDLPTVSETSGGWGLPKKTAMIWRHSGFADELAQLFRWFADRTKGMDHFGAEAFLREMFLLSPFGHSLQTRHAFDHLFVAIEEFRKADYTKSWGWSGG